MKNRFFALFRLNLHDLWLGLGLVGLPWLLLHLVTAGVMVIMRPDESIMISGLMLPFSTFLAGFSMTSGNMLATTGHALRMGRTRREGLLLALALSSTLTTACTALAGMLLWLERAFGMPVWRFLSRNPELMVDDFGCWWWAMPAAALIGLLLGLIYAALWTLLGNKAALVYMLLWFGFLALVQVLPWKNYKVVNILFPVLGVILVLAVTWAIWKMLHLKIRS